LSIIRTRIHRNAARSVAAVIAAGALAGGIAACGDDSDDPGSSDDGSLTVYSGREEEYVGPLFDAYKEETGTDVEIRYGESAELAATLIEEGENSPADVFFSQDAGSLGALQQEGLLQPLDDAILDLVDERFRSSEGDWVGTSGRARAVAYNSDAVSESDLPESVLDFTDPEWKGRIGWAPTNGSFQAFVTAMRLTEGEDATRDWLEGMVANDPVSYPDNEALRDGIAAGEVDVGLINHYYVAEAIEEEGADYPVKLFFPPNGDVGALVNVAGAGILDGADGAETGAEFIEFVLSDEQQEYFADTVKEYPLVDGVEADPTLVPLAEIEQPDVDLADLADLQATLTMIEESGAL
jgi:iron(III) transport system substrate-binding protein